MKTTTHTSRQFQTPARLFTRRILLKILPAALLALLLCGSGGLVAVIRLTAAPGSNSSALAVTPKPHEGYYWRNSMWLADARTYAHMLAYLLRPEATHTGTNLVVNG